METELQENISNNIPISSTKPDLPSVSDEDLTNLSQKDFNKLLKERTDERELRQRRRALKRKQADTKARLKQREAMKLYKKNKENNQTIAAFRPECRKIVSVKHRQKFERLLQVWENEPHSIEIINNNGVCFEDELLIGRGSYSTAVHICLGSDGIERAIKRLPRYLCKTFLKNERDMLTSPNAVNSPRIVNYWFYDETTSNDFGYLILNLYERNLADYIKEEGTKLTESCARRMIHQVLEGLLALHSREPRILHRDLKPSNILVDVNGDLLLSDFGIGRFFPEGIYNVASWPSITD
jgi:serine/threonine protein kinase